MRGCCRAAVHHFPDRGMGIRPRRNNTVNQRVPSIELHGMSIRVRHHAARRLYQQRAGGNVPFILWFKADNGVGLACGNKRHFVRDRAERSHFE